MPRLSIITAFYNEEQNLPVFRQRLQAALAGLGLDCQVVLVDDHSNDGSSALARQWADEDATVSYVRLSRNCGSHAAFSAGLAWASGDCAILLAADLQDPPELIRQLLDRWEAGHDVVWACRAAREGEAWSTKLAAGLYYRLMRRFALPEMAIKGADFLLMDRKVIQAYNAIPEKNTSFLAMILWLGFRQTSITYTKQPRLAGRSKWSFSRKVKLFIDSMVSFSCAPIRFISLSGMMLSLIGLLVGVAILINYLGGQPVAGWSALVLVNLVIGGFQLLMLGVLGEYLWRAYDESPGRPRYLIEEVRGAPKDKPDQKKAA